MSSSCLPKCPCNGPSIWDTLKPQQKAGEAQVGLRDAASFPVWVHKGAQDPTNLLSPWAWLHVVWWETRSCLLGVNEFVWETCWIQHDSWLSASLRGYFPFPRGWYQAVCSAFKAAAELVPKINLKKIWKEKNNLSGFPSSLFIFFPAAIHLAWNNPPNQSGRDHLQLLLFSHC